MTYVFAAMAAAGIFVLAGWRSKNTQNLAATQGWPQTGAPGGESRTGTGASSAPAEVGTAMRLALKRLAPALARQSVHAEIATPSELYVRMAEPALADLLEELLTAAIHSAPASRILLAAESQDDRVLVSITDDMPGAAAAVRLASLRGLIQRVTMHGGTLEVDVRAAEGTTLTLRLAAARMKGPDQEYQPVPEPALQLSGVSAAPRSQGRSHPRHV